LSAAWVKERQRSIFSQQERDRQEAAGQGATAKGKERKDLEILVAGIPTKVYT
jgi:hypothetical protein